MFTCFVLLFPLLIASKKEKRNGLGVVESVSLQGWMDGPGGFLKRGSITKMDAIVLTGNSVRARAHQQTIAYYTNGIRPYYTSGHRIVSSNNQLNTYVLRLATYEYRHFIYSFD